MILKITDIRVVIIIIIINNNIAEKNTKRIMAQNESTYLFYDKAVNENHKFDNKETMNVTIESIFSSNNNSVSGIDAIKRFNKCFPDKNYAIIEDLDISLYNPHLFEYFENNSTIRITVIEINNKKLKEYVEKNIPIPNKTFLSNLCKYHAHYDKASQGINILDRSHIQKKIQESTKLITESAMTPNADLTDPIEKQPTFTTIPLYNYQKRTIKWMLNRERNYESIYYNKNDEIMIGDVVYDTTVQDFLLAKNREKLTFKGGALIDEVGLGKTYQMITVSLSNQAKKIAYIQDSYNKLFSKATLVLCPNQLVGQWTREIEKVIKKDFGTNVISFFTKNHHDKYSYQDLLDADFVMISYNFLSNQCFLETWMSKISSQKSYLTSNKFNKQDCEKILNEMGLEKKNKITSLYEVCANPLLIHWHRIVVDEIHEIYTNPKLKAVSVILPFFQANYKWCLTATPFDKTDECLLAMVKYVTDTFDTLDNRVFKDKLIGEYLTKKFFRRNTKKSVTTEYKLPPLKEKLIWLNFSKTEWMMYNAYMANPNVDKFGVTIRQICCHPKLAEEIKIATSNCKSLEDIEKVMVKHYELQMKIAHAKVAYLEYRIKKIQRRIKILELKRQRFLIKKAGYKVSVEFANEPILSKNEVETLENLLKDDPNFSNLMIADNIDEKNPFAEDDSDDEEDKNKNGKQKKEKPLFIITEKNQEEVKKMIGIELKNIPETILTQMEIEKNFKERLAHATIEYKGKKSTYDYYSDVMSKLKTISETKKIQNDDDSDSDSDDDSQKCAICMGSISGHDSGVTKCGHIFCFNCVKPHAEKTGKCPTCQKPLKSNEILQLEVKLPETKEEEKEMKDKQLLINKVGTKLANLIFFLKNSKDHSIIFSQWDDLLRKVGDVLDEYGIKNVFCKGNVWQRDKAIREFNSKDDIKVIMLSSESAASGTNLTKAKNVILLDPVHGTYEYMRNTEWQAIGRAYRMGQTQEVNVVRFIIKNTVEEQIYNMNKDNSDKSPVETLKFEMNDDEINLDSDKINEILDASKKSSTDDKKTTKATKTTKITKTTKTNNKKEKTHDALNNNVRHKMYHVGESSDEDEDLSDDE